MKSTLEWVVVSHEATCLYKQAQHLSSYRLLPYNFPERNRAASVLGPAGDPTAPWGTTFSKERAWPYRVVFLSNYLFRALRLHNFRSL